MQNEKIITINNQAVAIRKIPLGKYPELIKSVQGLAAHKELFGDLSNDTIMQNLPALLMAATPEVIKVVHNITDVPIEHIETWGLDDFVKVVEALFELNDYAYVYNTLKKATTHLKTKPVGTQTDTPLMNNSVS